MKLSKKNGKEDDSVTLSVFGYSSRLFPHEELERNENSYLISWQDDDNLLIDRFDCRVFLQDLSEKTIGSASNKANNDEFTDQIEEELCDVERYLDLRNLPKEEEPVETVEKRKKGAEFAFNYGKNQADDDDGLSEGSDEEDTEPYKPPDGVKMPVGINLPQTAKLGHIIERTANFVVLQGQQMEIIIKAKHSKHRERFNFLEFDHPLYSFYKYVCKLIREKKYVPVPQKPKILPGEHIVQSRPENHESEEDESDSDDGDYLHPLLSASKPKMSISSPIPVPSNKANPYSMLYESLHPKVEERKEEPTTSIQIVEAKITERVLDPQSKFETDSLEAHSYNIWHQNFYNRPSIFLPNPPPKLKIPPADLMSQINVAARFVAGNGSYSEQNLLEHNKGRLNFLYPNNEYLIYYHCKVRFFQSRMNTQVPAYVHSKYHRGMMDTIQSVPQRPAVVPQPSTSTSNDDSSLASFNQAAIPPAPKPPEPLKITEFPDEKSKIEEDPNEEVKRKRRERAQQFMADIIRTKKAGSGDTKPEQIGENDKKDDLIVPADTIVPSLISTLISGQFERIKSTTKKTDSSKVEEKPKEKKRRRSRSRDRSRRSKSRERRHKRRRSRSPRRRSPSYEERSPERSSRRRRRS